MKTVFRRVAAFTFPLILVNTMSPALAADSPATLSGDYRLHFEQTSKSCGAKISPVDIDVMLEFSDTNVSMSFPNQFLGISLLDASFDPRSGEVSDQIEQRVSLGPTEATLLLDIKGNIVKEGGKTELRFEISFDKTADDAAWNCKVRGVGRAIKL